MKEIINGKKYDTETAEHVSGHSVCQGSFTDYTERLYKKKTGEFFLNGHGGPMSKYAESCGQNQYCGGGATIPITIEEAKIWVETYDDDIYEQLFGEVEE